MSDTESSRPRVRRQSSRVVADMVGRVCVVTGATRGIGLATAKALAGLGAMVVLVGRDRERGMDARQRVREEAAPGGGGEFVACDLSSMASVCSAAAEIAAEYDAIHVLVNNAGVHLRRRDTSVDGYEMTWAVNHLGPFLFTNQLLPQLRAAERARIVMVTSRFARLGRMHPERMGTERASTGLQAYCDTKLANMMVTRELARRLRDTGVVANCVHPGLVATDLMRQWPRVLRWTWEWALRSPESGAAPIVRLCVGQSLGEVTGRYYHRHRQARYPRQARDDARALVLWTESERLVGLASA